MSSQFDDLARAYESTVASMAVRKHLEYPSYMAAVGELGGLAVLDLGCGTGVYSRRLRERGAERVVGVDISEGMLAYARAREAEERIGVEYLARDITNPVEGPDADLDGAFDLVAGVYVSPYAPTVSRLHGLFRTARRALPATGGRFVTYALNPEVATQPGYYSGYDFDLVHAEPSDSGAVPEGAPLRLTISVPERTFSVIAYHWSRDVQEGAARDAGFTRLRWIRPHVSEEGLRLLGEAYWTPYLDCPHTLILDCTTAQTGTNP
ncbi:class I SAM-dependent methyltransferase [Streptomyces celluloflavus]|uniref:class I SAM-dependent methyltransferase n=1 Tax=Streptomyces celluloflavus TaxID=58344 RepID=UPI0036A0B2D2